MARDDYDDRPPVQTTNPGSAKAAAIIWIIIGAIGTIIGLIGLLNPNLWGVVFLLVMIAFLVTGIQTLSASVGGILGAGIGAIVLSVIGFVVTAGIFMAGAVVAGAGAAGGNPQAAAAGGALGGLIAIIGFVYLIGSILMLTSGILACVGSGKYKRWVMYKKGSGGRSRARDYEDDEDDRPRRRPARDEDDEDDRPRRRPARDEE